MSMSTTRHCVHEFPVPAYEGIDVDRDESRVFLSPESLGVDDGVWTCPHAPVDGFDRCLFHLPPAERPAGRSVTEAFLDAVAEANEIGDPETRRRHLQFIDAHFPALELKSAIVGGGNKSYIDLRHAQFDTVDCERAEFDQRIRFAHATFGTPERSKPPSERPLLQFRRAIFRYSAGFRNATFHAPVRFSGAQFMDWAGFHWSRFRACVDVEWATFRGQVAAKQTHFEGEAFFRAVNVEGYLNLANGRFEEQLTFDLAECSDDVTLAGSVVDAHISFDETDCSRRLDLSDTVLREGGSFEGVHVNRAINLSGATLGGETRFRACVADGPFRAEELVLGSSLRIENSTVSNVSFRPVQAETETGYVRFTGTTIESGELGQPAEGAVVYDISSATLGDVRFTGDPPEPLYEYVRLCRTRYDGFDFNDRDDLDAAAVDYNILAMCDRATAAIPPEHRRELTDDDRWTTYLYAKNGANDAGDNVGTGAFFYREMVHRRRAHRERARDSNRTLRARLMDATRWGRNLALSAVIGYGEKPDRVIYTSLFVVLAFAPLYALTIIRTTAAGQATPQEYLALSIQSYVTFVLGNPPGDFTLAGEMLSAFEAFIGAFLVALFVFTLTRRIHR